MNQSYLSKGCRDILLPEGAKVLLQMLEKSGYEAYMVGGCVRDSILGRTPHDWDIATNATPNEIKNAMNGIPTIDTGLKHGTVTILYQGEPYEVTTYRREGNYTDGRHPDEVTFVDNLAEDLARRDFTMNAMAYHPEKGLIDLFHGEEHCQKKMIVCVGNPDDRMKEDALRIMRAVRFAAQLGFHIEPSVWNAMLRQMNRLQSISAERIRDEFVKIMKAENPHEYLDQYDTLFFAVIPELKRLYDCRQNHPCHIYTVWKHTLKVLMETAYMTDDLVTRLAALFHDVAKPSCKMTDENGVDHFYDHGSRGEIDAKTILRRLRFDNDTIHKVSMLVLWHDKTFACTDKQVVRWLSVLHKEQFQRLLVLRRADILGQNLILANERLKKVDRTEEILQHVLETERCFQMRDMVINGSDLISCGISEGKEIGFILKQLFDMVLDERCPNEKNALLEQVSAARKEYQKGISGQ